jgi:hypothetical protein
VAIVDAPAGTGNSVLMMTSLTGDPLAVSREIAIEETMEVSFEYVFDDVGKIEIFAGALLLDTLDCPASGAGAPGSGAFAQYVGAFDLSQTNIDFGDYYEFQISLSGLGAPTAYIDDLEVVAVPEPIPLVLLTTGALGLLVYGWRKRRR